MFVTGVWGRGWSYGIEPFISEIWCYLCVDNVRIELNGRPLSWCWWIAWYVIRKTAHLHTLTLNLGAELFLWRYWLCHFTVVIEFYFFFPYEITNCQHWSALPISMGISRNYCWFISVLQSLWFLNIWMTPSPFVGQQLWSWSWEHAGLLVAEAVLWSSEKLKMWSGCTFHSSTSLRFWMIDDVSFAEKYFCLTFHIL